ncbi:MAG: L-rhamnose/proton symporter RhaT [Opitutaceae bacterium]|jgi:L-rhamnose-H+ transport protein
MNPNPFLGVFFHWLGGLASGSFYVPYRGVRRWSWETYWLVGGVFSWIIAPWVGALSNTNDVLAVLAATPGKTLFWTYFFGAMWGLGGLTFGLTMRYLGMSLGMAVALGYCAAFGTLIPPLFHGTFVSEVLGKPSGIIILVGVGVCLLGIAIAGLAGKTKEGEMTAEQKRETVKEFNFKKGILVATFSGIMSACFSFGLDAGGPIKKLTLAHGTPIIWQGLPVLIVILLGGFTTNFIWCALLNFKNRTGYQYFNRAPRKESPPMIALASGGDGRKDPTPVPLARNYVFSAMAGVTWYMQFFFYSMGETQMGKFGFSSWTLHMASIIIFSSLWGLALHEWKGASGKSRRLLFAGLSVLIISTLIVGYGNYLGTLPPAH